MITRQLTVYTARSRKDAVLQETSMDVGGLFARLSTSQELAVTHGEYMSLRKPLQDDLKDIGGYIPGQLKDGRRRKGCIITRSAAVLDADNLPSGSVERFAASVAALGCCYCIHSTAKHSPGSPRLRVVIPFSTDIPAEQYPAVVRLLCRLIQPEMSWFDPTTVEAGRIMFWSAHCKDVEPVFFAEDRPFLDPVQLLERLPDWKDPSTWPRFPREAESLDRLLQRKRQQDPEGKTGIVGAFCRVYGIEAAMDKFLPGVYESAGEGRYTFAAGSTAGGAVLYDNGKFLYSHHATDPCGGQLVNAWDMVRLHKFGGLDDEAKPGTKGISLPSFKAMAELAQSDEAVSDELAKEAFGRASTGIEPQDEDAAMATGRCAGETFSLGVLRTALKALGIVARHNLITGKAEIAGLPGQYSQENAANVLPVLLLDTLRAVGVKGISKTLIADYLAVVMDENRYNPVLDMLHNTAWDGAPRFNTLANILYISPDSFHALLLRKWLIQSVALAHNTPEHIEPADGVLVVQSDQGFGKTQLFRRLAIKHEWFSEGVTLDLRNKDSVIRAVSAWITELGELDETLKYGQSGLKAFLTQKVDKIRVPYARESSDMPRRASFCASVNPGVFLKDETGDRRMWVIPVTDINDKLLLALPDEWFMQLWAEAYIWWQQDPQGFRLSRSERQHLNELNRSHREALALEDDIRQALDWDLPHDQWGRFTSTDIKKQVLYNERAATQQIGRVLAALAREYSGITVEENSRSRVKTYTLPLRKVFQQIAE